MSPSLPPALEAYFEVERELGAGSFGRVLLARVRKTGERVALKVMAAEAGGPELAERFRREAKITEALRHPHIVGVRGSGQAPTGELFIAYEFVHGPDLEELVRTGGTPSAEVLARWGGQVARALHAAHQAGVVHRDVKPANVLLRDGTHPLLCDFGLARSDDLQKTLTVAGMILGTVAYMPPETLAGTSPGPAADQFSWAASLFEVAYGTSIHGSEDFQEVMARLAARDPVRIPAAHRGRNPGLEGVLLRALAMDPGERFPDLAAFAAALERGEIPPELDGSRDVTLAGALPGSATLEEAAAPTPVMDARPAEAPGGDTQISALGIPLPQPPEAVASRGVPKLAVAGLLALAFVAIGVFTGTPPPPPPEPAPQPAVAPAPAPEAPPAWRAGGDLGERFRKAVSRLRPGESVDRIHEFTYVGYALGKTGIIEDIDAFVDGDLPWTLDGMTDALAETFDALEQWMLALARWESTHGDGTRALRDPEVARTVDEYLFGRFVNLLEMLYLAETRATERTQGLLDGEFESVLRMKDVSQLMTFAIQSALPLLDSLDVEESAPLSGVRTALAGHIAGVFLGKKTEKTPEEIDLARALARRLETRFRSLPAGPEGLRTGKALLYLLTGIYDQAVFSFEDRRGILAAVSARLANPEAWPDSVEQFHLTLRLAHDWMRLYRLSYAPNPAGEEHLRPLWEVFPRLIPHARGEIDPGTREHLAHGGYIAFQGALNSNSVPYGRVAPRSLKVLIERLRVAFCSARLNVGGYLPVDCRGRRFPARWRTAP